MLDQEIVSSIEDGRLEKYVARYDKPKLEIINKFVKAGLDEWDQKERVLGRTWVVVEREANKHDDVYAKPLDDDEILLRELDTILETTYKEIFKTTASIFVKKSEAVDNVDLLKFLFYHVSADLLGFLDYDSMTTWQSVFNYELQKLAVKTSFVQRLFENIFTENEITAIKTHIQSLSTVDFERNKHTIVSQTFLKPLISHSKYESDLPVINQLKEPIENFKAQHLNGKILLLSSSIDEPLAKLAVSIMKNFDVECPFDYFPTMPLSKWLHTDGFKLQMLQGFTTDGQIEVLGVNRHLTYDVPTLAIFVDCNSGDVTVNEMML